MKRNPIVLSGSSTEREAAELIVLRRIVCVLVLDDKENPVGIVTERDLVSKVVTGRLSPETPLVKIMSCPLLTVSSSETLGRAAREMTSRDIKRLPVVDDGTLVGILTLSDVLRSTLDDPSLSEEAAMEYIHEVVKFVYSQPKPFSP